MNHHMSETYRSAAVSVVIAALNAENDLPGCLESIRRQRIPDDAYEIVVADGGSVDATRRVAENAGARVINNPFRGSEPGYAIAIQASRGQFVIVLGADNRMRGSTFIERMLAPFEDPAVVAAFPRIVSTAEDGLVGRYINRYSDPFNAFVYGSFNNDFDQMLERGELRPTVVTHPLMSIAQGGTFRSGVVYQGPPDQADDVLAIIELIEQGGKLALVGDAELEHHSVKGLRAAYQKYSRRTRDALGGQQGFLRRQSKLTLRRRFKQWLWLPYSATLIAPAIHGALLAARHRNALLLYHPVINTVIFAAVLSGALGALGQGRRRAH